MNCIKCNNPLPDGAKFCPSCGASYLAASDVAPSAMPAPETEKKYYCEKCGLELSRGVKFCSVCGGSAVEKNVAPIANNGATFGAGAMSAVSLDKPSASDGLVSAMNSAAETAPAVSTAPAAYSAPMANNDVPAMGSVPMPTSSVPMPTSSVPTPSEGGFNSGFTAPAPSFAPSANAADMTGAPAANPFPDMVGSAAAVAVKPIKKKGKGKIALIIIAAVVVLLGALAVVFFTNRAGVLSTIMGKSKYAAMVEGNHIKQVTDKIDFPAVSNGIKSASGVVQMVSGSNLSNGYGYGSFSNYHFSANGAATAPMMMSSTSNGGMEFDLSAIEKMYAELLQSTYGHNSLNASVKANVEIGDSLKSLMKSNYVDTEEVDEFLKYLNGTEITYNVTATDDAAAFSFGTNGKLTVNAKVLMSGQDMYISLPFVSDKAILFKFDMPAESAYDSIEIKPLELDEKELERIITDIVKIYLEHYKSLEIEMENGELTAAGVTVSGKLITAEFDSKKLLKLCEEIAEYLAGDDYLAGKIVEFANSCGADMDEDDYADAILDIFEDASIDEASKVKLVISTVINNNGDVLGKSVEMTVNKEKASFAYAETKEQSGCEMKFDDVKVSVLNEKENDQNGTCTLKVNYDSQSFSFILKYADVKKTQFCGNDAVTGKFTLSMKLPSDFKQMLDESSFAAINGAKLTLNMVSDSPNTFETSVGISAPGYIDASVTETVTVQDSTSDLTPPAGSIDITPLTKGGYLDDQSAEDLVKFIKDIVYKIEDMGIDTGMSDILDYIDASTLTGKVSKSNIDYLLDCIDNDIETINMYADYFASDPDMAADLASVRIKYDNLSAKIKNKNYSITQDEFDDLYDEYMDLYYELRDVIYNW